MSDAVVAQSKIALTNKLLAFNERYIRYTQCNSTTTCPANESSYSILDASYQNVVKDMNTYNLLNSMSTVSPSQYDASYNSIIATSKQNIALRTDLDNKMRELLEKKDSIVQEQGLAQQSNVYTGMLLTILASTLLFYVFRKL